jgi:hypothetical protein
MLEIRRTRVLCSMLVAVLVLTARSSIAAITVAAADSLPEEKKRADLVCDGKDDQVELAASFLKAPRGKGMIDINPKTQKMVEAHRNHVVEWLPGTYHLSGTLEIPDAMDCVIRAEGTTLRYDKSEGDCVVIRGMNRCRYTFGTVDSKSTGAAIRVRPKSTMPSLMSFINFMGLVGHNQKGTGLLLDPTNENVCVNRFEGTDIAGFDTGVFVGSAGARETTTSTHGKCDTNWFWVSYVRLCNTCVHEKPGGVDCSVWQVNVDASLPGSVAIRAAGKYGKWYVIMGAYTFERQNKALILEPGAEHTVFEIHPPIDMFLWENKSGNDTNIMLSAASPGYKQYSKLPSAPKR